MTRFGILNTNKQNKHKFEISELEERYEGIVDTDKAAVKGNEEHDTRNTAAAQDRRENAAATEAKHTLDEGEAREIEIRSIKCSCTATNQRGVPVQSGHRRQDGCTSTPCGSAGVTAGKRLQEQRPQGDDDPDLNSEEHLEAQVPHQDEEAGSIVFHSSSNATEFKNENKESSATASVAAKVSEDFPSEDTEILRLTEEMRRTTTEGSEQMH